jgi:hypothetical protein
LATGKRRVVAEKLENFPGGARTKGGGRKYPWDEWLDGSIWLLRKDEDYSSTTLSFRATISKTAKREGKKVRSRTVKDERGEGLAIQAYED